MKQKLKRLLVVVASVEFLILACGCAHLSSWYHSTFSAQTQAEITAATQQLEASALSIAMSTVESVATGTSDAQLKNNFLQSAGDALRALEGTGITAGTHAVGDIISAALAKWLPNLPHWSGFSDKIGALMQQYAQAHPKDPNWVNHGLEAVANALNTKTATPVTSP